MSLNAAVISSRLLRYMETADRLKTLRPWEMLRTSEFVYRTAFWTLAIYIQSGRLRMLVRMYTLAAIENDHKDALWM